MYIKFGRKVGINDAETFEMLALAFGEQTV
jgi:hypothetical protein